MRTERNRKKKLIVAFHFLRSDQAGWKCDVCRKSGLEKIRRCGFLGWRDEKNAAPVWLRKGISLSTCPKSHITAESIALLEEFETHRQLGALDTGALSAKQVEAFAILKASSAAEEINGYSPTTRSDI